MKKLISLFLITALLVVSMLSAVTVNAANAQVLKTTEVLVNEDFEPPVGFTGAFSTDAYKYYSMFSADDIAGDKVGYKGWKLTAGNDEVDVVPSIYHVAQRTDVARDETGNLTEIPTTYLDLRRYTSTTKIPSIYYDFGVQNKDSLIVRFTLDLLYSDTSTTDRFRFSAKYFADYLTYTSWQPMNGTAIAFTEDQKALFKKDQWNKIEFLADYTKNEVTLFVNGVQIGEPQKVNQTADFKEVRLWGMNNSGLIGKNLYIDNVKLEKVAYVDEAYIANGAIFTKPNGSVVSALSNGDVIKSIRVEKDNAQEGNCTAIVARYNSSDMLISTKIAPLTAASFASNTATIDANIPYATGDYIKVFFLDNANIVKPLASASTFLK